GIGKRHGDAATHRAGTDDAGMLDAMFSDHVASFGFAGPSVGSGPRERVLGKLLAQPGLADLAGRGMRNFGHYHDVVGIPPLRHSPLEEAEQIGAVQFLPVAGDDDEKGSFIPFGMP